VGDAPASTFEAAVETVREAAAEDVPLRLLGGQAVRLLTPDYPPRAREDQDMDLASVSSATGRVIEFLKNRGFVGDDRFNALHGHRQMYFTTPEGTAAVDVVVDELAMCHVMVFKDRIGRMPFTLDVTDLLLSKLQVVELNEKDVHDILYLLSAFEVNEGDEPGTIGLTRIGQVVGDDWGWWRTVTGNLERVSELASGDLRRLVPARRAFDPSEQARAVRAYADQMPKGLRWKIRSRVGERVRWYELPEEVER
jgi:hypothetical protein